MRESFILLKFEESGIYGIQTELYFPLGIEYNDNERVYTGARIMSYPVVGEVGHTVMLSYYDNSVNVPELACKTGFDEWIEKHAELRDKFVELYEERWAQVNRLLRQK